MNHELTFDYHGLVGLRLQTSSRWTADYFSQEYGFAAGELPAKAPRVELRWRDSTIPLPPGGGYRLKTHKALARWFYKIRLSEDRAEISAAGNRASVPMAHHMLVHPCLRYLCSQHRALLLHGSALSRNGRSIVITGPGGAGKTTASSLVLAREDRGWRIQGDDYALIGEDGRSFSYATRAHIYRDLFKFLPGLRDGLTNRERFHVQIFGLLRELTRDRVKWPLRMGLDRMWAGTEIEPAARLGAILLIQGKGSERVEIERVTDTSRALDELIKMNFREARHFIRLIQNAPDSRLPSDWLGAWKAAERDLLTGLIEHIPVYRLSMPTARPGLGKQLELRLASLVEKASIEHA